MVKRNIIRTRDAIKFIGDGQEQKLKKDRLIESWIKVTLLYSLSSSSSVLHSSFSANFINTSNLLRCFSIALQVLKFEIVQFDSVTLKQIKDIR